MTDSRVTRRKLRLALPSRWRAQLFCWGAARVALYLAFVVAILLLVTTAAAYNRGQKLSLELGEQWVGQLAPLGGQVEQVLVNGASFSFAAVVVDGSADQVLARVERDCRERSGDIGQVFDVIARSPQVRAAVPEFDMRALTLNRRDGVGSNGAKSGDVACALRDADGKDPGILARLRSFSETGNLSAFGKMRYVRADQLNNSHTTRLLALWTEDPLNLERMFAEAGDASGSDPQAVPRPPASRRLFSGVVPRSGDGVYGYESNVAPGVVLAFYEQGLSRAGWSDVKLALRGQRLPADSRAFLRDGRATLVTATRADSAQPTSVALVVLEARRVVSVSR